MKGLEVQKVEFFYGTKRILHDISFTCRDGELVGIVGPNGSGKTTLLRIIAGYLKPTSGLVRYNGEYIEKIPPKKLASLRAVVEQSLTSPFEFTVYEYVMLGRTPYLGRFQTESTIDIAAVDTAIMRTQLGDFRNRSIGELSGGELQKAMIARALAQDPSFLILDEPTAHLDISNQMGIMELLANLANEISVIAVVHDLNLAVNYCDQIAVLNEGNLAAYGPTDKVLEVSLLKEIFDINSLKLQSPAHVRPQLAFVSNHEKKSASEKHIHVMGGGGCAQRVLFMLHNAGYTLSAGVLNEGDRDLEVAQDLGCSVITAPPFSRITHRNKGDIRNLCEKADAIVIAAMPIGEGNVGNLEVANEFTDKKPIVLYTQLSQFQDLDYIGGRASSLYEKIKDYAYVTSSVDQIIDFLKHLFESSSKSTMVLK